MQKTNRRGVLPTATLATAIAFAGVTAAAQDTQSTGADGNHAERDRARPLRGDHRAGRKVVDEKRYSTDQVDSIVAEDIGKFPDLNLAGIAAHRASASTCRRRPLDQRARPGGDFSRVRINGLEA